MFDELNRHRFKPQAIRFAARNSKLKILDKHSEKEFSKLGYLALLTDDTKKYQKFQATHNRIIGATGYFADISRIDRKIQMKALT